LVYLLVLQAVTREEINVQEVGDLIKHDLAISYKLLRFLNSARFAFRTQIKSIRHALMLLGQNEIRKWIGLISVAALGEGAPPVLVNMALIRGAFCESLAPMVGAAKRQSEYFFLGLLSCIDVIVGRPMRLVLAELPIAPDVSAALMGEQNPLGDALQTVISYEQGNWAEFSVLAQKLAVKEEALGELYMQALHWSGELTSEDKDQPVGAAGS
jgi:EAL and modified HD-GYP domain-containing signal transduction protein